MGLTALAVVVIVVALGFDFTNGFHDAGNAIATSVSTRALSPRAALLLAAVMNVVGALLSTRVAATVSGIVAPSPGRHGLAILLAALVGAIAWNIGTWWLGLPSSSSHALIGGLVGAALAGSDGVVWSGVVTKFLVPTVLAPLAGLLLAFLAMVGLTWLLRRANAVRSNRNFRRGQVVSAAAMALAHGTQDAQKTMGVIALALFLSRHTTHATTIPLWVVLASAGAIALGTWSGGWRVTRTLGRRIFALTPIHGFAAQGTASAVMLVAARFGLPLSTTHVISGSVAGVGATRRLSAVRWGMAGRISLAWLLTLPATALAAALVYTVLEPLVG